MDPSDFKIYMNDVAQALTAAGHKLYYWKNENVGEVDFVIQGDQGVVPVEVKKAIRTKSVSFNKFRQLYSSAQAIRFSKKNFGLIDDLQAIPLYAIFCLRKSRE